MGERAWTPDGDRLIAAELAGEARRRSPHRRPSEAETAAAAAELAAIAGGRGDLLAEQAGLQLGFYLRPGVHPADQARACAAALFLIRAGADLTGLRRWIGEGRRRARAAGQPPFGAKVAPDLSRPLAGRRANSPGRAGSPAAARR